MKPLDGYRIVDLTHAVSGPFCTYQLRMLGAEVVKVERPDGGDPLRQYIEHAGEPGMSTPFISINAGKKSMKLDLKSGEGRAVLARLVADADVLIENYRPGVAEAMGIDFSWAKEQRADIIYCAISGFGQQGELKDWSAYDHIVQAISGLASLNGLPDSDPVKLGIPISDLFAGYMSAFAVTSALLQRERDARAQAQYIDVSMLDASMVLLGQTVVTWLLSGYEPRRLGNRGFRLTATADTYETSDGYVAIGANWQPQFEKMCTVLGAEHLITDERFKTPKARLTNDVELTAELQAVFRLRTKAQVELALSKVQVPVGAVRTVPEIVAHPHIRNRHLIQKVAVPGYAEPVDVVGAGFLFAHDGPSIDGSVPLLGADTDAILQGLGYTSSEIADLQAAGVV